MVHLNQMNPGPSLDRLLPAKSGLCLTFSNEASTCSGNPGRFNGQPPNQGSQTYVWLQRGISKLGTRPHQGLRVPGQALVVWKSPRRSVIRCVLLSRSRDRPWPKLAAVSLDLRPSPRSAVDNSKHGVEYYHREIGFLNSPENFHSLRVGFH